MLHRVFKAGRWRVLGYVVVFLALAAALLSYARYFSADRHWETAQAAMTKEGETLEWRRLLAEPPPDELNFCAIPELDGITDVVDGDRSKGEPAAKRKVLAGMSIPFDAKCPHPRPSTSAGIETGHLVLMDEWAKYLAGVGFLKIPTDSKTPSLDVLAALDAKFPLLQRLAERAPRCPKAMFLPSCSQRSIHSDYTVNLMPHLSGLMHLSKLLHLRAKAAFEARQPVEGANTTLALIRLIDATGAEPSLMSLLSSVTWSTYVQGVIWDALHQHLIPEPELKVLQEALAAQNLEQAALRSMRGELAICVVSMDGLKTSEDIEKMMGTYLFGDDLSWLSWLRISPRLVLEWKIDITSTILENYIVPLKRGGMRVCLAGRARLESFLSEHDRPVLDDAYFMTRMLVPSAYSIIRQAILVEARNRLAIAAIAVERFRLQHGRVPDSLSELKPDFMSKIPVDPLDGADLRFRRDENGSGVLWSIGFDSKDDGGTVPSVPKAGRPRSATDYDRDNYLGDWVWQYVPLFPIKAPAGSP